LVAQDYTQQASIDFEETFAQIVRLESIMMLLAYVSHNFFILYQTNVKNMFLHVFLDKEVYVEQPLGFVN
jgi:Reverse transcriptase (RNA-dependent DNA polymerase)